MNRIEALAVLGISDIPDEDLKDAFDECVFRTRNELLRHVGVPLWIMARVKSLSYLREAADVLGFETTHLSAVAPVTFRAEDPIGFLRDYEATIAMLRLRISTRVREAGASAVLSFLISNPMRTVPP